MKNLTRSMIIVSMFFIGGTLLSSCSGSGSGKEGTEKHEGHDHKDMKSDKKEASEDEDKELTGYICPMKCEGEKTYEEAGKCPECGMDLKPVEEVMKKDE